MGGDGEWFYLQLEMLREEGRGHEVWADCRIGFV